MNTVRDELLEVIGQLSSQAPEFRLGQLVVNLSTIARGATVEAPWDVEDEELLAATRRLLANLADRNSSVTPAR